MNTSNNDTQTEYSVLHIEKQREYHVLPCREKLSESELDCIAFELKLAKYHIKEMTTEKSTSKGWKFDYYHYVFTY